MEPAEFSNLLVKKQYNILIDDTSSLVFRRNMECNGGTRGAD